MEIDFSSVWSWTLPLWTLVVIVACLGGILIQHPQIVSVNMREIVQSVAPVAIASVVTASGSNMPSPIPVPVARIK